MKTFVSGFKRGSRLLVFLLGLSLCQTLPAAVGYSVTPSTVSDTYSGIITLQITGLSTGAAVVVQKFLDANTNGVIEGADLLWQQFQLTDGQASVIGGITNINVPGDTDATPGQITARLIFHESDFPQSIIGKYAYKLSSPTGLFSPITNSFTITNAAFTQSLTGNVVNNGTNVPNAVVLVFQPEPGDDGPGSIVAGAVANNAGSYAIKLPVGTYVAAAFKSNYLGYLFPLPVAVGSGLTVATNITLTTATRTISGKVADAADNSIGLPGLLLHVTAGGLAAIANSDTNGNFIFRVGAGQWEFGDDSVEALGYVSPEFDNVPIDTTTGSVSGLIFTYPKATALIHGSVRDNLDQPLAGVNLYSEDNNNLYERDTVTDNNGYYVVGALGGGAWSVDVERDLASATNYVFSDGLYTNLGVGQAVLHNFTAVLATNRITGHVQGSVGNALFSVRVYTYANLGGRYFGTDTETDTNGNYSLNVPNGNWGVGICCSCDDWPDDACCPSGQSVNISNANGVVDFTAPGQILITTPSPLPDGHVDSSYSFQFSAVTCSSYTNWSATNPPSGLNLTSGGVLHGVPVALGSNHFFVRVQDGFGNFTDKGFSLAIQPATNGGVWAYYINKLIGYRQTNAANVSFDSAQGPYNAYLGLVQESLGLVSNATCALPNSMVKTFPSGISALELQVHDTFASQSAFDAAYPAGNYLFAMHTVNDGVQSPILNLPSSAYPNAPHITNYTSAQAVNPNNDFLLHWDAFSGGTNDDFIRLFIMDSNEVTAFKLQWYPAPVFEDWPWPASTATTSIIPAGALQGGRTYLGLLQFVRVVDVNDVDYPGAYGQTFLSAQTVFSLATASAVPTLSQPTRLSANQFRFLLTGLAGQNYTIQKSTNLSSTNWSVLFVTNAPAMVIDSSATNNNAFYRALLGP